MINSKAVKAVKSPNLGVHLYDDTEKKTISSSLTSASSEINNLYHLNLQQLQDTQSQVSHKRNMFSMHLRVQLESDSSLPLALE